MPELGSLGSVRGALSNERPYRECVMKGGKGKVICRSWLVLLHDAM